MNKCLVIGYGSIGRRHAGILEQLGCDVSLVTAQQTNAFKTYATLSQAVNSQSYDYVVIANPTHLHRQTLQALAQAGHRAAVLVEKPLFADKQTLSSYPFKQLFVAYNLRFSKMLHIVKQWLAEDKLISFSAHVGQYLPTWRPDRDYRASYSAKKELGGGVLMDLSHELDYSVWLCGKTLEVAACGGQFSDLQITSDDVYSILMRCESCPIVTIQMNYLDRVKRRDIVIHTQRHTIHVDLVNGILTRDGERIEIEDPVADTYVRQHEAILSGDYRDVCTYEEGLATVNLIHMINEANNTKTWIAA